MLAATQLTSNPRSHTSARTDSKDRLRLRRPFDDYRDVRCPPSEPNLVYTNLKTFPRGRFSPSEAHAFRLVSTLQEQLSHHVMDVVALPVRSTHHLSALIDDGELSSRHRVFFSLDRKRRHPKFDNLSTNYWVTYGRSWHRGGNFRRLVGFTDVGLTSISNTPGDSRRVNRNQKSPPAETKATRHFRVAYGRS